MRGHEEAHWAVTSSPLSLRVMARLRRLMTVTITMAWERDEWAFISVDAKIRFWSPRCSSARQSFVLRTYSTGLAIKPGELVGKP